MTWTHKSRTATAYMQTDNAYCHRFLPLGRCIPIDSTWKYCGAPICYFPWRLFKKFLWQPYVPKHTCDNLWSSMTALWCIGEYCGILIFIGKVLASVLARCFYPSDKVLPLNLPRYKWVKYLTNNDCRALKKRMRLPWLNNILLLVEAIVVIV